jgi:hypothetical protein
MGTDICKDITQIKIRLQELQHGQIFSYLIHVIYFSFHFKTIQQSATQNLRLLEHTISVSAINLRIAETLYLHSISYWG